MTDPFMDLVPPGVTLGGPAPNFSNDNVPATPDQGFHGLLLRKTSTAYEIILCHRDPDRSQRVETAEDDTDVIALWRSIGQKVNLPLLAETPEGIIVEIEPSPWRSAQPRRGGSALTFRRPRFLARRKIGLLPDLASVPMVQTAP